MNENTHQFKIAPLDSCLVNHADKYWNLDKYKNIDPNILLKEWEFNGDLTRVNSFKYFPDERKAIISTDCMKYATYIMANRDENLPEHKKPVSLSTACFLTTTDQRVLTGVKKSGKVCLPAGAVDPKRDKNYDKAISPELTARRELEEETGLGAENINGLSISHIIFPYPGYNNMSLIYTVSTVLDETEIKKIFKHNGDGEFKEIKFISKYAKPEENYAASLKHILKVMNSK